MYVLLTFKGSSVREEPIDVFLIARDQPKPKSIPIVLQELRLETMAFWELFQASNGRPASIVWYAKAQPFGDHRVHSITPYQNLIKISQISLSLSIFDLSTIIR